MMERLQNITLYNADCMDIMRELPDKAFDLAIVDPPYGINAAKMNMGSTKSRPTKWDKKDWDSAIPSADYFQELFRVSKNQIIFGGNYFTQHLPPSRCWLSWNKGTPTGMSFADFELAWTSFDAVAREVRCKYSGIFQNGGAETKIHPTQKPASLYRWILDNYYTGGGILDTHLGSGSSAIAAHDGGFEFTGIELDPQYYAAARQRIMNHQAQGRLAI